MCELDTLMEQLPEISTQQHINLTGSCIFIIITKIVTILAVNKTYINIVPAVVKQHSYHRMPKSFCFLNPNVDDAMCWNSTLFFSFFFFFLFLMMMGSHSQVEWLPWGLHVVLLMILGLCKQLTWQHALKVSMQSFGHGSDHFLHEPVNLPWWKCYTANTTSQISFQMLTSHELMNSPCKFLTSLFTICRNGWIQF